MGGAAGQSLRHLGPGNFAMVMGLAGLGLAWHRAEPLMGPLAGTLSAAVAALATLLFLALGMASVLRAVRHPEAWAEDLKHPVRHAFVAAIPISLILLATLAYGFWGAKLWVAAAWGLGCVAQAAVTLWVLARWWRGPAVGHAGLTPVLIIPVVGNVLAPLAGVGLGFEAWSAAQFGLGLFLWPLVLALLFQRLVTHGLWPERLLATGFITIAPPAVVGLAALQFGAPPLLAWMAWGVALGFLLLSLNLLPRLKRTGFALPFWALSFPLAAFATLTLRVLPGALALVCLAAASVLVLGLLLATLRAVRDGQLWLPEPSPAGPSPVG
jgi:tellurite resistance protein